MFVRDLDPTDPGDLARAGIDVEVNDSSQEELSDAESVWVTVVNRSLSHNQLISQQVTVFFNIEYL